MGKIKIYEIAKKLNLTSKEVLEMAQKLNIDVKSHMSGVEEEEAKKIEAQLTNNSNEKTKNSTKTTKKEEKSPVIIRREVIIEEENKKQEVKKEEKTNNGVGFVERKQNNNYNIVYRNKPNKPKTVSELFGIKKEEPKAEKIEKVEKVEKAEQGENNQKMQKEAETKNTVIEQKTENRERNNRKDNRPENNRFDRNDRNERNNNYNNRNNGNRQNNFNNSGRQQNNYNNENRNNFGRNNNNNNYKNYNSSNNNGNNNFRKNNNRNNYENNGNVNGNGGNRFNNRRPLDEKGIEKNIKNIMSVETAEKEIVREYNKNIDKQKNNNKFDENKTNKKSKNRKNQNSSFDEGKLKSLKQTSKLSNMFEEQDGGMLDYYDLTTQRGRKGKKKPVKNEERNKQKIFELTEIEIPETITVKDLAAEMKKTTAEVIKKLLGYGIMATINQDLDFDTAFLVAGEFGITAKKKETVTDEDILFDDSEDKEEDLEVRPPVVVVMGHVDHGKTSLLDYIRKANVIAGEAGGITQHIGAYHVTLEDGRKITFLDTPGHEAFTAMRARGAKVTDIAIIIVAADDDVMPQTKEAINHAAAAGVPIVFAINKIDKPHANPEKIKETLAQMNYLVEEWGGKYQSQDISAKKGLGVPELMEKVLLEAEMLDLKANPNRNATGSIIESTLDKGRGYVATVLVSNGTLKVGDIVLAGTSYGRVKAMFNERNQRVAQAGPSEPVLILGLNGAPAAGDTFHVIETDQEAREIANKREQLQREQGLRTQKLLTLDEVGRRIALGNFQELNVIVKGDVDGSIEALSDSLIKLSTEQIQVNVIHKAVGQISESDVTLAAASDAIIIGFQVRPSASARKFAEQEGVDIRLYSVIYAAIEEVKAAMEGMLAPEVKEVVTATIEVREVFHITKVGTVAGAVVKEGKVKRSDKARLIRDGIVIFSGSINALKRFKDDVKEVGTNFECGISLVNYNDLKVGDMIETYEEVEVKQTL